MRRWPPSRRPRARPSTSCTDRAATGKAGAVLPPRGSGGRPRIGRPPGRALRRTPCTGERVADGSGCGAVAGGADRITDAASQRVTIFPWTPRPACSSTASRILSTGIRRLPVRLCRDDPRVGVHGRPRPGVVETNPEGPLLDGEPGVRPKSGTASRPCRRVPAGAPRGRSRGACLSGSFECPGSTVVDPSTSCL